MPCRRSAGPGSTSARSSGSRTQRAAWSAIVNIVYIAIACLLVPLAVAWPIRSIRGLRAYHRRCAALCAHGGSPSLHVQADGDGQFLRCVLMHDTHVWGWQITAKFCFRSGMV
jgi:hypothetical protein